jgi:hypothetical protein
MKEPTTETIFDFTLTGLPFGSGSYYPVRVGSAIVEYMNQAIEEDQASYGRVNPIPFFNHSLIDDMGLTPSEFRVYGHLVRRAGSGYAYASVNSMAKVCKLKRDTVYKCIAELENRGLIRTQKRHGKPSHYHISRINQIPTSASNLSQSGGYPLKGDTYLSPQRGHLPVPEGGHKGSTSKGTPTKDTPINNNKNKYDVRNVPASRGTYDDYWDESIEVF